MKQNAKTSVLGGCPCASSSTSKSETSPSTPTTSTLSHHPPSSVPSNMSRGGGTTLYVTGFGHGTRARDLAYEFERYARLRPCPFPRATPQFLERIPPPITQSRSVPLLTFSKLRPPCAMRYPGSPLRLEQTVSTPDVSLAFITLTRTASPSSSTRAGAMPMTRTTRCTTSALVATTF